MFNNIELIRNIINSTMIYIQTHELRFKFLSLTINDVLYDKKLDHQFDNCIYAS